jgi:CheY-like chemotaxis protein
LLRRAGYTVLMARDGQEAVEVYQRERARIALVILDLVMPRLSGQDALRELLRLDPGVRVVVCSGQAEEEAGPGLAGALGFLAKPYRDQDLPLAVRRVLDRGLAGVGGLPAGLEDSTRQSHSGGSV